MAVFADLDLRVGSDLKALRGLVENAAHLGYSVVAINHVVEFKEKKQEIEKPVAVSELFTTLPIVQVSCTHLDVDLVCITVTEKLPFYFKRPPINVAIDRGVGFELVYSPAIKDSTMRRYTISNALNLMQVCKGKNIIISSAAERPLEIRGPYDVANLGLLFGLSENDAKAAVSTNCRAAILHGETRKTAFGIIATVKKPRSSEGDSDPPPACKKSKCED
ncbi:ribonuclease P protein subunit p30 isoform X4 [Erinaceus europaeus]|uniref:Ribonuclease P protein subunit p30 isoform X4 n=1 Tax=Erinaceus europaeus TaxID=9365 RepID=A0ABM3XGC8_ERIEU|nr:ribonuclease P protein subunit p30 isoform X4 [Erinaceus europaeus]